MILKHSKFSTNVGGQFQQMQANIATIVGSTFVAQQNKYIKSHVHPPGTQGKMAPKASIPFQSVFDTPGFYRNDVAWGKCILDHEIFQFEMLQMYHFMWYAWAYNPYNPLKFFLRQNRLQLQAKKGCLKSHSDMSIDRVTSFCSISGLSHFVPLKALHTYSTDPIQCFSAIICVAGCGRHIHDPIEKS